MINTVDQKLILSEVKGLFGWDGGYDEKHDSIACTVGIVCPIVCPTSTKLNNSFVKLANKNGAKAQRNIGANDQTLRRTGSLTG